MAAPATPTNLQVSVVSTTSTRLVWAEPDVTAVGYKIYRSDNGGGYAEIDDVAISPYLDTSVLSLSSYSYRIRAYNVGAELSSYSAIVSVIMPVAPRPNEPSFLFLLAPTVVYSGVINMASPSYPIDEITYDGATGTYSDIWIGQTITFGTAPGLSNLGRQRVRSLPGISVIGIGRSSRGRFDGEIAISDNVYFDVWDDFRVWSRLPYIAPNGDIFKDSRIAISNNTLNTPPVSNCGPGFADTVNSISGLITVQFDSTSFATAPGATITAYLWNVADGVVTAGGTTTATMTCTFVAGFRWVHLTITDSNGKTHTSHAPVYARDPGDGTVRNFQVTEHSITPAGQKLQFNIREDISAYPDGCLVMLWSGAAASPADRSHMHFIGWHNTDTATIAAQRTGLLRDVTLDCVDVAGALARLSGYSQLMEHNVSPTKWTQYAYLNMDRFAVYLLYWHSTALELADFQWSGTGDTYAAQQLASNEMNMLAQVTELCQMFVPDYVFTCNRRGQLAMKPDPMIQEQADRTSTVQVSLYAFDYSDIQYTHQYFPTISRLDGGAVLAGLGALTSLFCYAPGVTFGQGVQTSTREHGFTPSQDILNKATGHRYARMNSSLDKLRITLAYGDDRNIEPADLTWVNLDLPAAIAAQRGLTLSPRRGLVQEMSIRYDYQRTGTVKTVDLTWECETVGYIGQTYTPPGVAPIDNGGWTPVVTPADGVQPSFGSDINIVALIADDGYVYRTNDFQSATPTWTREYMDTEYDCYSFVVDPFSPLYRGTGSTVQGYYTDSNSIFRITDIFTGDTGDVVESGFPNNVGEYDIDQWRTIEASFGRYRDPDDLNPWLMVVSYLGDASLPGTNMTFSVDGGTSWYGGTIVGGSVLIDETPITGYIDTSDVNHGAQPIGVYLSPKTPGLAYTFAYSASGDPATGAAYYSTDWGANWSPLTNPALDPGHGFGYAIHVPYIDNAAEDIVYHGWADRASTLQYRLKRVTGALVEDISPLDGGLNYGVAGAIYPGRFSGMGGDVNSDARGGVKFGVRTYDSDRAYVALAGMANDVTADIADNSFAVFVSNDYGDTWTRITSVETGNGAHCQEVAFSGDDPNVLFMWGRLGYIRFTVDFGANILDKTGNLLTDWPGIGNIIGLVGGEAP